MALVRAKIASPRDDQNRVQPGGQIDTVDQLQQDPAATQADEAADAKLLNQVPQQPPMQTGLAAGEHADQGHGQEHRHGIVAPRLDLKACGDTLVQAFAAEQREHRCGVCGTDNGADQQALNNAQVEQPRGDHAGQYGGNQHAHRCQRQGRPQRYPKTGHPRSQAAVEQDDGQREIADQVGGSVVIEDDPAAIHARHHAHGQNDDQDRDAEAR